MKTFKYMSLILGRCIALYIIATPLNLFAETNLTDITGQVATKWAPVSLPAMTCSNAYVSTNCHDSSPALADINNDGKLDIVLGTNSGHIVVVKHNGQLLWDVDVSQSFGMAPNTQEIESSPAVGDIDGDGLLEIVVGTGTHEPDRKTRGGVIVLEHNGSIKPGWPKLMRDTDGDGWQDSVFSTPALGDLTNDGKLEIVFGSFDKGIYAMRQDGSVLPGFPADSFLKNRFPTWPNLTAHTADTIWSSPALADMNRDGDLEIIIGTDEGNFSDGLAGDQGGIGWICPYVSQDYYCGGSVYVLDNTGENLPGFPKYVVENVMSAPAVQDLNQDGYPEIFVGTGEFYHNTSPDHLSVGFKVFGWDHNGNDLPGWIGGKTVQGPSLGSPSIGDITGDGVPEIVTGTSFPFGQGITGSSGGKIYAWQLNGALVSGFPMQPIDLFGNIHNYRSGVILADYDGDSKMEIFVNQANTVAVIDGNGQQLTNAQNNGKPLFFTEISGELPIEQVLNSPAVGDLDGDGKLELVAQNSSLFVWELSNSTDNVDWGMFKRNSARTSAHLVPQLLVNNFQVVVVHQVGTPGTEQVGLRITAVGELPISWSGSFPAGVSSSATSGTLNPGESKDLILTITPPVSPGFHDMGDIQISGTANGVQLAQPSSPITVRALVGDISRVYLPTITK